MFRLNRGRIVGLLLTGFIIYFLFLSSANTNSDFRKRTEEGLSRRHGVLQGDLSDEDFRDETNRRLNNILAEKGQGPIVLSDDESKPAPPKVAPRPKEDHYNHDHDDDSTPVAGRKTMQKPKEKEREKEKPRYPVGKTDEKKQESVKKVASDDGDDDTESTKTKAKSSDPGKDFAREKLQEYLKKPLIIFSKSYCPHSKNAKHLLLDLYKIVPAPLVVELDQLTEKVPTNHSPTGDDEPQHVPTLGQELQELLGEITGRRTVPNIMVGTTSIGGNDLIWEMHEEGRLVDRIKALGGKRITSVEVVEDMDSEKDGKKNKEKR